MNDPLIRISTVVITSLRELWLNPQGVVTDKMIPNARARLCLMLSTNAAFVSKYIILSSKDCEKTGGVFLRTLLKLHLPTGSNRPTGLDKYYECYGLFRITWINGVKTRMFTYKQKLITESKYNECLAEANPTSVPLLMFEKLNKHLPTIYDRKPFFLTQN